MAARKFDPIGLSAIAAITIAIGSPAGTAGEPAISARVVHADLVADGRRRKASHGRSRPVSAFSSSAPSTTTEADRRVLHHGYETSGCIVHAAKSMTLCCSALT